MKDFLKKFLEGVKVNTFNFIIVIAIVMNYAISQVYPKIFGLLSEGNFSTGVILIATLLCAFVFSILWAILNSFWENKKWARFFILMYLALIAGKYLLTIRALYSFSGNLETLLSIGYYIYIYLALAMLYVVLFTILLSNIWNSKK